ncbi:MULTISPECIES: shikimate 5-dehydrogenase [Corynebacterium]|uniref:shikimate 5-dehydrogenase n=1 Tax=Corynebacterium TaxID=1716 RepID=UPI0008A2B1E6|nr:MULTISPECIES: shikimate 5-dehydrogenase [Corynebacterium]MCT1442768.1 shikimate 5-dehydrogenase [Corynebacterium glucuronolyticum]OFO42894.1 shikimate 5-dehydrogenase [Corynebacterium sp. HMSC073D01]
MSTLQRPVAIVDNETTLCISLAARPSNHGVRFHNYLYAKYGLNFLYKAVAPRTIEEAVAGIRGLDIRGAGVSMPYKQSVIPLLDAVDASASRIEAVNTIVNDNGYLTGFNTDYIAVSTLVVERGIEPTDAVAVRGSGGMANAVVAALTDTGFSGTIVARNHETGPRLATRYGWKYSPTVPEGARMLVNVTPLGMKGENANDMSFTTEEISAADIIFDCVAYPVETPLVSYATQAGKTVLNGGEIIALQAAEQFEKYTGIRPSAADVEEAESYTRNSTVG